MNTRWFLIFKKLFAANSKEFLRDFIPPVFTMATPTAFMLLFGFARKHFETHGPGGPSTMFLFVMMGMLSIGLINLSLFGTTTPLLQAKERGVLRQYMVIPIPLSALLASHVSVRLTIALIQGGILIMVATFLFNVNIVGSWFELTTLYIVCAAVMIMFGYALAALIRGQSMGQMLVTFLNLYMVGFGQIFTDMRGIPVLKWLIYTTPATPVSDLLRRVCVGPQWSTLSVGADLAILCGWALVAYVVAVRKFSFLPNY